MSRFAAQRRLLRTRSREIVNYRNRFSYVSGTPDARTRGRGQSCWITAHSSYIFRYLVGEVKSVYGWAPANQRGAIEDPCVCTLLLSPWTARLDHRARRRQQALPQRH